MSKRKLLLLAAGALALLAGAFALSAPASAATVAISIQDFYFSPQNVTVEVGDTVNWTNMGANGHDVSFQDGFGSGTTGGIAPGTSFEWTFAAVGVYKYHCNAHAPGGYDPPNLMIGRVTVVDAALGPSVNFTLTPPPGVAPNATVDFAGRSTDNVSVAGVFYVLDGGNATSVPFTSPFANSTAIVDWSFSLGTLPAGNHTVDVFAQNGSGNGTPIRRTFAVLSAPPPPVSPPATWQVSIVNITVGFSPNDLEVATGDTVVWTNIDSTSVHDVTFQAGFKSGDPGSIASGKNWSYTFDTPGTYLYHCQAHNPSSFTSGVMLGRIVVIERALRPAVDLASAVPSRVSPGGSLALSGTALDNGGVTGVYVILDGGAATLVPVTPVTAGDARNVTWNISLRAPAPGSHTLRIFSSNGAYNSTAVSVSFNVAPPPTTPSAPGGNPFGDTFVFEDIMAKYFWLIVGVSVILLAVVMMFLSYSGKLQNYYIVLLTALDERHRFFAYARPTREFLFTIQRQMPRTHTERYNLKVIWYWYPLYCLGGLAFAAFIIETITGIILGFYYIPEGTGPNTGAASPAYNSMTTIMTQVTFGYAFRALHHWGAHMMVAAVFLHMMRVYFVGAYKNPRELNWLLGVILLTVTLLFGYTGYLLPWDQLSFWAGQIGLEMANTIPVIGEILGNMVFGGPELSAATIIRMYYLHVFVLPLVGGALMVLHMGIVWMQGVAEPH